MNQFAILPAITLATLLCVASQPLLAAEQPSATPANMLVYISPKEFTHEILLRDRYYQYWYSQGPKVEFLAKQKLGAEFGDVAMCKGFSSAKTVVLIKPSMFYNPISLTYYGEIVAEVFAGNGDSLGTYIAKSQRVGYLDVDREGQISAAYTTAMNDVVKQMAASSRIHSALDNAEVSNEAKLPCSNVSLLSRNGSGTSDLLDSIIY